MDNTNRIDILEDEILKLGLDVLEHLLWDHSRATYRDEADNEHHHHIYWATDMYEKEGEGFGFFDEINIPSITGEHRQLVRPRAAKSKEEQDKRTKEKAEVFTPSWVCNAQNNLIDEAWFGRPDVFNTEHPDHTWTPTPEKITFPEGKTWQDYVWENRMEMTCGEGPYLVSRYDTTTGEPIDDLNMRIGILDRKLRVVSENIQPGKDAGEKWIYWGKCALKSTYGFEWQGDNLLLAREAVLYTFIEYYEDFCRRVLKRKPSNPKATYATAAYIISWNLWQMDGITYTLPMSGEKKIALAQQGSLFDNYQVVEITSALQAEKIYAKITEWFKEGEANNRPIEFRKLIH